MEQEPIDCVVHVGATIVDRHCSSLTVAETLLESGELSSAVFERYESWLSPLGQTIDAGQHSLATLHDLVLADNTDARPPSGRQELLENIVNKHIERIR